jgi:hypothetical protein
MERQVGQCWVILSRSEQFYTESSSTEGIIFNNCATCPSLFHIVVWPLQPVRRSKYHGRLARSSDRHCHFFRNHDFCLALAASTASFLIPITAYMAWRSLVRGLQQLAANPIMQRRRR